MKKSVLLIALTMFILTSATAIAGNDEKNANITGSINFTDRVVYVLDHTSDPTEGNWITMECSSEERRVQLPQPIKLMYCGPKYIEYGGASGTLYKSEGENYTITYPSDSIYLYHPVYLPGEKVNISFHGNSSLKGDVEIYLFNITSNSTYGIFDTFKAGETENLDSLFHSNMDGEYRRYHATLGKDGDILDYSFGPLEPGQYCIVIVQENNDGSLTVFSATAFAVVEYELQILAPTNITKGEDLDINICLEDAPDESNCTYGALLIKEQAYKADIKINSNGTRNGTSIIVNEVDLIEEFDVNSSNYRSKFTKDQLQTEIQTMIGEGKGSIAIGEKAQKTLSLTAFDLPPGHYYLLAGAYIPGKGLVGLAQTDIEIKPKNGSENNGGSGNGGTGGNNGNEGTGGNSGNIGNGGKVKSQGESGGSPEPVKNVISKEICQQSISNGTQISFKFTSEVIPVEYVQFNAKKSAGKTTAVVESLKGRSSLTHSEPKGEIYKYLNIWIVNSGAANSNNSESAVVGFKVGKNWITENNVNIESIILQHFSENEWNSLPTKRVGEDEEYIYFEAKTTSFSPFAITAEKNVVVIEKNTGETQINSETESQSGSDLTIGSDILSQKSISSGVSKIASFFVGFLIVILIGTVVKKINGS